MSEHNLQTVQRYFDVAVVGGSAAGLAAALQLGRQRRSVIVVDSGEPRNAAASHMHGFLGRDGTPPAELMESGRAEVRSYGGEILSGRVERVTRSPGGRFLVELAGGSTVVGRRVLAATGLADRLPAIDGLAGRWGQDVIHCPFCHGYEVRDRDIVQIVTHPAGLHSAPLFRQLAARLTVVLHQEIPEPAGGSDQGQLDALRSAGVEFRAGPVTRIVTGADGGVEAVELAGGDRLGADAVVVVPGFAARIEPFAELGLKAAPHPSGMGDFVETDGSGQTAVRGLYAAGNLTDPGHQVLHAAADGARVGAMISFSLAGEDLQATARPSANQADWDHRYSGEQIWSGNPNGTLVDQITGSPPGRALDVGAGEGGDALWLAARGWEVTASEISRRALDRIWDAADRRGLHIGCLHTDANSLGAFPRAAFDLVSAHYAAIPRTPDGRAVENLMAAVAPGGTLLVVSHDMEDMPAAVGEPAHVRPFDPEAYVGIDDFAAAVGRSPGWEVQLLERRLRPPGAASAAHHVHDVVLRARRSA